MRKQIVILAAAMMLAGLIVCGCNGSPSIIGKWVYAQDTGWQYQLEFAEGEVFIYTIFDDYGSVFETWTGTYTLEGDQLKIYHTRLTGEVEVSEYRAVVGDETLVLYLFNGPTGQTYYRIHDEPQGEP